MIAMGNALIVMGQAIKRMRSFDQIEAWLEGPEGKEVENKLNTLGDELEKLEEGKDE